MPHETAKPAALNPAFSFFSKRDAKFLFTATQPQQYERLKAPEVTFAGRSNVGKSSLISAVLRSQGLAKTSKKPGHTSTLNFFGLTSDAYPGTAVNIVDMPGYGFRSRDEWGQFIMEYLSTLDAKVGQLKTTDLSFLELVEKYGVATQLILTKTDKLKHADLTAISNSVIRAAQDIAPSVVLPNAICCSFKTKTGIDAVQEEVLRASNII
ncbi:hypothetical protein GGI05_003264 [Coemansia sp. RSA 2603]|nr:hypothetical protein GGI05_003264 [Coemansia sp. RSA 2603]